MSSYLVNMVADIENKRYLELGIYDGVNFGVVGAKDKVSVDAHHPADFRGSTDAFFAQLPEGKKFDVVYIDADHSWRAVVRDFNNVLKHLAPGGLVFVHDLIPGTEELTAKHFCGDGFKVLHHILTNQASDYEMCSLDSDYGMTLFVSPKVPLEVPSTCGSVGYQAFEAVLKTYPRCSRDEMRALVAKITAKKETPKVKKVEIKESKSGSLGLKQTMTPKKKGSKKRKAGRKANVSKKESSGNRGSGVHRSGPTKKSSG